jgi:hypothetical protein
MLMWRLGREFLSREADEQKLPWSFCRPNARAAGSKAQFVARRWV